MTWRIGKLSPHLSHRSLLDFCMRPSQLLLTAPNFVCLPWVVMTERKSSVSWEDILASGLGESLEWRRSSRCNGGACVEATVQNDAILVRNSSDPDGPILAFSLASWRDSIAGIKWKSPMGPEGFVPDHHAA